MDVPKKKSKRGPKPLASDVKRTAAQVSIRLNAGELALLDSLRGKRARGEWMRLASLAVLPPVIPEINAKTYAELARSAGNLNQIARYLNAGKAVEAAEISAALSEFRQKLLGVEP